MRMWKTAVENCEDGFGQLTITLYRSFLVTATVVALHVFSGPSYGQSGSSQSTPTRGAEQSKFSSAFESPFSAGQVDQRERDPWKFEGRLHLQKGTSEGYLVLQMDLEKGHYIYSVSPQGSPAPTRISVIANRAVRTSGAFAPNVPPEVNENDPVFHRRIEKHKNQVQFFVPCQLDPSVDIQASGMPVIEFNGQVCSTSGVCTPISSEKITVKFAGFFERDNQSADNSAQPPAAGKERGLLGR